PLMLRSRTFDVRDSTLITARPLSRNALRERRTTCSSLMKPSFIRVRSVNPAGRAAPWFAGTFQRLCGPPGPLKDPRSIGSNGPVPDRWYGWTYGLFALSPISNVCVISWVMVPELSPWRMPEWPHSCEPANHEVQS